MMQLTEVGVEEILHERGLIPLHPDGEHDHDGLWINTCYGTGHVRITVGYFSDLRRHSALRQIYQSLASHGYEFTSRVDADFAVVTVTGIADDEAA